LRSEDAISNLTLAISKAQAALRLYEESLEDMRRVQQRLSSQEITEELIMREEPETSKLYTNLITDLSGDGSIGSVISHSSQQIASVEEGIRKLRRHYETLQDEIIGWKTTKRLAKMSIDYFDRSTEKLETQIGSAKFILSPISAIPAEVCAVMFKYCLNQEMVDYIEDPGHLPLRSLPLVLSSVCQKWSNIVRNDLGLWKVVKIQPNQYNSSQLKGLLEEVLRRGQISFIFFTNLSHSALPILGNSIKGKEILPEGNNYTTHLFINEISQSVWAKTTLHPFRNAITIRIKISSGRLSSHLDFNAFPMVQSLDLECSGRCLGRVRNLTKLHYLTILNLRLRGMPNLHLNHFFKSDLEELRIRYSGGNGFMQEASLVSFPKLRLLGITYPSTTLVGSISVPNLEEIEIYKPNLEPVSFQKKSTLTNIFREVQRIKILDWNEGYIFREKEELVLMDAGNMFVKLAGNMDNLKSVLFSGCDLTDTELVSFFRERSRDTTKMLPSFECLTFSDCKGLTRAECEELQTLVPRLSVYV
jgi:hypothetical protein